MARDIDPQGHTVETISQPLCSPEMMVLGLKKSPDAFQCGLIMQLKALVAQLPREEFDITDGVILIITDGAILISNANKCYTVEGNEVILVRVRGVRFERTEHGRCMLPQKFARLPERD